MISDWVLVTSFDRFRSFTTIMRRRSLTRNRCVVDAASIYRSSVRDDVFCGGFADRFQSLDKHGYNRVGN